MAQGMGLSGFRDKGQSDIYFALGQDQSVPVYFLRELADALWIVEHQSPGDYRRKIVCTCLEGKCHGCEQASTAPFSGWTQKPRLYIDCIMGKGGFPTIMSQSLTSSALTDQLLEYYSEHGTITDTWFQVTKSGTGKKTKYRAVPISDMALPTDVPKQLQLSKALKHLQYEHQSQYFT